MKIVRLGEDPKSASRGEKHERGEGSLLCKEVSGNIVGVKTFDGSVHGDKLRPGSFDVLVLFYATAIPYEGEGLFGGEVGYIGLVVGNLLKDLAFYTQSIAALDHAPFVHIRYRETIVLPRSQNTLVDYLWHFNTDKDEKRTACMPRPPPSWKAAL